MLFLSQPRRLSVFFATSTHWWFMSNWCPPGLPRPFLQSCFPAIKPPACTGSWDYSSTGAAFPFAEPHKVLVCSFLQPVLVPLNGNTTTWSLSHSSQLLSSANLLRAHPTLSSRPPNENVKQNRLQYQPLGYINSDQPPAGLQSSIHRRLLGWLNTISPS